MRTSTRDLAVAADALERAVLEHAQQPHLRVGRQLADLVEEERSAVGALEPALPLADRAGEAAALVTEELGIDQSGRDRAAVHAQEGAARAP